MLPILTFLMLTQPRVFAALLAAMAPFKGRLAHPAPDRVLVLGFLSVFNTLRQLVLQQQLFETEPAAFDDDFLIEEQLSMLVRYSDFDRRPTAVAADDGRSDG
jgi:hypothetical protein